MDWTQLTSKRAHPRITVVGDAMLDRYLFCEAYGLTPEDPIAPKLKLQHTEYCLGGAANVAANLAKLGAIVTLIGVRGEDAEGGRLVEMLTAAGVKSLVFCDDRVTTVKTRVIAYPKDRLKRKVVHPEGRYICRVDVEDTTEIAERNRLRIIEALADECEMLVVSDYAKGVIDGKLIRAISGRPYVVDPKRVNMRFYGPALVVTPNALEAQGMQTAEHDSAAMMITRSGQGASLLEGLSITTIPVRYRTEGDATGCGDSAIAGLAFGLAIGLPVTDAAYLSMACGACAVDHEGVKAISLDDAVKELAHKEYARES